MFLVDRLPPPTGLRPDLAPRQLFGAADDLVRDALTARPPTGAKAPQARDRTVQLDLALPLPARRRKAG